MHVIAKRTLRQFWTAHPRAENGLRAWYSIASKAEWKSFAELRTAFSAADIVGGTNRVIFDIGGNKFRLVAIVLFNAQRIYIRFVGTHAEYDKIDAGTV